MAFDLASLLNDWIAIALLGTGAVVSLVLFALIGDDGGVQKQSARRMSQVSQRWTKDAAPVQAALKLSGADSAIPGLDLLVKRWLPRREALRDRLARTGKPITIGQYVLFCGLLVALSAGLDHLVFRLNWPVAILGGIALGVGAPHKLIGWLGARRIGNFTALFPEAIDLIVRGLRSGLPVQESIAAVGQEIIDPVGLEFRRIDQALKFGQNLDEALWQATKRIDSPEFKFFVISLSVQRETGGNLAETLENLSDILRRRRQMKLKIKAMSSEAKASAWIIGSLPFIMFAILFVMNGDYVMQLFQDPRGMLMVGVGLASLSVGVLVMGKMVRFEI